MNQPIIDNCRDDLFIKEQIDGKTYLMARPSDEHEAIQSNIAYLFSDYFRKSKKACRVKNEAELRIDKNNWLVPDLMVFCYATDKNIPLLVIEILSKSTRAKDFGIKMAKYAEIGVAEYWIVDTKYFAIDIYLLGDARKYAFYKSYAYYTEEDFSKFSEIREEQESGLEMISEFSPVSFPEMKILLEEVFYYIKEE